ncbi:MAG TPA: hypothetical protein VGL56_02130 [Fimbriimonadaceae bacterium]|jgi:hypothetical protein
MNILPALLIAIAGQGGQAGQAGQPGRLHSYPAAGHPQFQGANLIPNGDFSQGNTGFMSSFPYTAPAQNALWGGYYTIAKEFNRPQLHDLIATEPFTAAQPNANSQIFFANAGGVGVSVLWSSVVNCQPNTAYRLSFKAISLSGSRMRNGHQVPTSDWVPHLSIGVNWDRSSGQPTGCGEYQEIDMNWNSGSATSAAISIVRRPFVHGGGLIGIADIRMVPAEQKP